MGEGPLPEVGLAGDAPSRVPDVDAVALPFAKDGDDLIVGPGAAELLRLVDIDLLGVLELHGAKGTAGEVVEHLLVTAPEDQPALHRILLVGVGATTPTDFRRAGAALARRSRGRRRVATSVAALA